MALAPADSALIEKLAIANRILYSQGVVDGFGHVSVRHDKSPDHFLLSCNRAPGLVRKSDILTYDLNGDLAVPSDQRSYLERFIHGEIYRARPDVMSVVHSHSVSVIPFGVTGQRLRPIFHMSGFLGSGSVSFEIRDAGGNTDLLIRDMGLGKALAKSLGQNNCVLMRGHGSTVVGPSIEQAVYRAVYAEENAKLQLTSAALGPIEFLNAEEAELAMINVEGQVRRPWELWSQSIGSVE
ncbi:MAG: class II aldolase/adducin family protein [Pseudomonadota bacterium]